MIGFDERTDNKEKIGLEGTGSEVCGRVTSSLQGGLHALTIISELHLEHKQNVLEGTGGEVCGRVTSSPRGGLSGLTVICNLQ